MSLKNTAALVTGASRGLGRALSLLLAQQGARVVMVARHKDALDDAVAEVTAAGGTAFGITADVGDKQQIHAIAGQAAVDRIAGLTTYEDALSQLLTPQSATAVA